MENQRPTLKNKVGFALGHVMNDMCASMWFTYLLLYFHEVLKFDNIYAGTILLIGQLADGFSTVFVGVFSDKGDNFWLCNRFGQRKAWHLIGCVCVVFSFPFIFTSFVAIHNSHQYAQLFYYSMFVVIFQFGWAATQISHLASIPDLAENQNERTGLTAWRSGMTVLANVLVYIIAWVILNRSDNEMVCPDDAYAFRNLMLVCISVGIAATIGYHLLVKFPSAPSPLNSSSEEQPESPSRLVRQLSTAFLSIGSWFKEFQLYQIGVIYMTTRLFVNLSQAYIPLYIQVTLQLNSNYVATVPLAIFVSGFVTSFAMKPLNRKLGRKITFILGGILGMVGCIWIKFAHPHDENIKIYVYCASVFIGIGGSTMLITSLSLTAEFIGTDTSSSAFIYGLMSLTDKVSNGLAVVVIQHFIPTEIDTCILCRNYYRDVIMYACGGASLIGIFASISLFPVTVGVRRSRGENQTNPTVIVTQASNTTINEESDERTPLLA